MVPRLRAFSSACIVVTGTSVGAGLTPDSGCRTPLARSDPMVHAIADDAMFHPEPETDLYELNMLVCPEDAPQTCEIYEQILEGLGANPGTAFMQAQPFVARWLEAHPGYVVRHWRLLPGRGT